MSASQSGWWGMLYISQLKTYTTPHFNMTAAKQSVPNSVLLSCLERVLFFLFSDLITIFCYCIQFKNSVSLTQRQARQPDQNHVGAVLSTGSGHLPKLLSAPTVPSYTPVSLGWAKSKPCYAVLPQGHRSGAQNQGQLQN